MKFPKVLSPYLYLVLMDMLIACHKFLSLFALQCVQYVDNDVLNSLVPKLCEAIKSGIGLGTKVSAML